MASNLCQVLYKEGYLVDFVSVVTTALASTFLGFAQTTRRRHTNSAIALHRFLVRLWFLLMLSFLIAVMAVLAVIIYRPLIEHASRRFGTIGTDYPVLLAMAIKYPCPVKFVVQSPPRSGNLADSACKQYLRRFGT